MPNLTLPAAFIAALDALTDWLDAEQVPYTQRPKDIADIEAILSIQQNLDFPYIRRWVKEFAAALEMPKLLEDLERILSRN